ncbi:hypothetical protein A2U01_0116860, partial [Trifolium medium]|nr:hypothetical protein [Trifolium medium]
MLTDSNYHSWPPSMHRTLGKRMKLEFIDHTIPIPIDPFDPA